MRPDNPILIRDIERCPYTFMQPEYVIWTFRDDLRLRRIRKSYLRFLWRMFQPGAWRESTSLIYVNHVGNFVNRDLWT